MSTEILLIIDKLQKLDSRRLQTLWEWKNRVLLEECYIFYVAIPPEEEFGTNRRHALDKTTATVDSTLRVPVSQVPRGSSRTLEDNLMRS